MKKILRNIVILILLGFFLTGFCGIHFIKYSCFSCEYSEIYFVTDADFKNSKYCYYNCNQDDLDKKYHTKIADVDSFLCCDYDLVYLKTDPNTTLIKTKKNNTISIVLFSNIFNAKPDPLSVSSYQGYINKLPDDLLQTDCCKLCTFLC